MNFTLFVILSYVILSSSHRSHRRKRYQTIVTNNSDYVVTCYGELGCLETSKDWHHPKYRPINLTPAKRHTVKTSFIFYAPCTTIKADSLEGVVLPSNFKFMAEFGYIYNLPVIMFIHDFTSNGYTGWIKNLVKTLLINGGWNIFSVDWEFGARPPYPQAVANTRVVALEIVHLLRHLKINLKLKLNNVHLVGHGLGGHIAGYTGGIIREVGRITALDPSGPYFEHMPTCVRLDHRDADLVIIVHTDTVKTVGETGQGFIDPIGHFNFYPNQGYSQPGCEESLEYKSFLKITEDGIPPGKILPGCSHKRAIKYVRDTLQERDCIFIGIRCESKEKFSNGDCTTCGPNPGDCVSLDIFNRNISHHKPEAGVKLFFITSSSPPFCLHPYNVVIQMSSECLEINEEVRGVISAMLQQGNTTIRLNFVNKWPQKFAHGGSRSFLAYHPPPRLHDIDRCQISWESVGSWLFHKGQNITIERVYVTTLADYPLLKTLRFCSCDGKNSTVIQTGKAHVFVRCESIKIKPNVTTVSPVNKTSPVGKRANVTHVGNYESYVKTTLE